MARYCCRQVIGAFGLLHWSGIEPKNSVTWLRLALPVHAVAVVLPQLLHVDAAFPAVVSDDAPDQSCEFPNVMPPSAVRFGVASKYGAVPHTAAVGRTGTSSTRNHGGP